MRKINEVNLSSKIILLFLVWVAIFQFVFFSVDNVLLSPLNDAVGVDTQNLEKEIGTSLSFVILIIGVMFIMAILAMVVAAGRKLRVSNSELAGKQEDIH